MSFVINTSHSPGGGRPTVVTAGTVVRIYAEPDAASDFDTNAKAAEFDFKWKITGPYDRPALEQTGTNELFWNTADQQAGAYIVDCTALPKKGGGANPPAPAVTEIKAGPPVENPLTGPRPVTTTEVAVADRGALVERPGPLARNEGQPIQIRLTPSASALGPNGVVPVSLQRTSVVPTIDQALWVIIRNRTNAINFRSYRAFADSVMCGGEVSTAVAARLPHRPPTYYGSDAYHLLKKATELILMQETGVLHDDAVVGVDEAALVDLEGTFSDPDRGLAATLDERRRLGRTVTVSDIRQMRNNYYEELAKENVDVLPYLRIIRERLAEVPLKSPQDVTPACYGILRSKLTGPPLLELIWSYWHEEGMLAQTLNAILARFQNRRLLDGRDPLARFDLEPLRPLSNLFWGWVQDEVSRLTVRRRAYEYDHEYGLKLIGRAVPTDGAADRRSKFLESFHSLLNRCHVFFKEDDDTTVIADGFPLLNALRETHLLLAEGAHNQFGDLPWTARAEMLIMQWLLARPEMREFLGGRVMVPYEEDWMDRVDTMKAIQGWTDVTVTHFRDLGVFGEQILLSIRYGNWSVVNDPHQASNWARYWRPEIQRYAHAYRAATGVDLSDRVVADQVDATLPSIHLQRRLVAQQRMVN